MSRKRRQYSKPNPTAKPGAPITAEPRRRNRLPFFVGALIFVIAAGGALAWARNSGASAGRWTEGSVTGCQKTPPFAQAHGFSRNIALDTSARLVRGMLLYQPDQQGQPAKEPAPYQHPSWSSAGYLTPPKADRDGAVYVAPVPWISVLYNPPERANTVYRIDPQNEQMAPLVELPPGAPANPENVYGILALTYDCDTHSLYVSSVYGSSRTEERGRLFRVDLATRQATVVRDNIDAFGLAVYNGSRGKRLYYALARRPEIYSIALGGDGNATGEPRAEIEFADSGVRGNERARRIQTQDNATMTVTIGQFDYTLSAPTDPRETTLIYNYDRANGRWVLRTSQR